MALHLLHHLRWPGAFAAARPRLPAPCDLTARPHQPPVPLPLVLTHTSRCSSLFVASRSLPLGLSQKWSKGKVKEKLANLVLFDKTTYEKMLTDVPKQKLITPSIISEKLKVNGSLARKAVKELLSKGLIRPILTHKQQSIYTRATNKD